jgi:hypothetical protein
MREKSFNIPHEGLAIYVNNKYYDNSGLTFRSYDETEDDQELIVPKKKRVFNAFISDADLYFEESHYITKRFQSIGKGLFTRKVIIPGTRFPSFKGNVISAETYTKKSIEEKGYGIQVKKNELILDCYSNREICMASYANSVKNLVHSRTKVEPKPNAVCKRSSKNDPQGKPVFYLQAIKQIEIDEEVFWYYDLKDE